VVVLCLVQFVDVLGVTSAVTAIPEMLRGVDADSSLAGPVATSYAMFFGGLLVLGARLGQKYGHRRVLTAGLLLFVVAGVVGGVAASGWQLVTARSLQGAASAVSVPSALSLLLAATPRRDDRSRALAAWSGAGAAAGATGFFVGGAATEVLGWQAVFWLNVPVGIVLVVCLRTLVGVGVDSDRRPGLALDVVGAALLVSGVMGVVGGTALLERPSTRLAGAGCIAASLLLAVVLWRWLRRAREPIVPVAALQHPRLLIGLLGSFVNTAATSSTGVLLTLDLQDRQGLGAFETGLILLPLSATVIVGSAVASRLVRLSRRLTIGAGLGLIGLGNLVAATAPGSVPGVIAGIATVGLGLGLSSVGCTDIGTAVAEEHTSTATGLLNTGAQLGTAVGVAVLVLVAAPESYGDLSGTTVALGLAALLALASAGVLPWWASSARAATP
jgi:MFS family permease